MRPYRQTAPHHPQHPQNPHILPRPQREKSQGKQTAKSTLSALFHQHASTHHTPSIHIDCNRKINVIVEKATTRRPSLLSDRKKKRKLGIVVGSGTRVTLEACLQKYTSNTNDEYILTSHPRHNYEQFPAPPRGKAISVKSRSSSQTSLGSYCSSNKKQKPQNYPTSHPHIPANQSGRKFPHQFASEKVGGDKMFVVQENPGQSLQSQRESLPRQPMGHLPFNFQNILKPNIKEGVNTITAKYIEKAASNHIQGQGQAKPQIKLHQNKRKCQEEKENHAEKGNHIPPIFVPFSTNKIENPKFSFAEVAMKGLFPNQPLPIPPPKQQGFSLPPIEQSQQKKQLLPSKGLSSMSDLSSIAASNLKQAKHLNFLEIDSIRNQLEKVGNAPLPLPIISKPSIMAEKEEEKPFIQIKINNIDEKPGDVVQIEEKALEQNRSQYFIRYNLKEKKGPTDVIRISPLKFRKKEEVVRQFVKARIVSKQSDSINIP